MKTLMKNNLALALILFISTLPQEISSKNLFNLDKKSKNLFEQHFSGPTQDTPIKIPIASKTLKDYQMTISSSSDKLTVIQDNKVQLADDQSTFNVFNEAIRVYFLTSKAVLTQTDSNTFKLYKCSGDFKQPNI